MTVIEKNALMPLDQTVGKATIHIRFSNQEQVAGNIEYIRSVLIANYWPDNHQTA